MSNLLKFTSTLIALAVISLTAPAFAGESLIATHSIRAGTILSSGDVTSKDFEVPGAARTAEEVIGLEVRRNLYAGRPVLLADLGPPTLVHRNELVTMTYQISGLIIRTEGRALEAGGKGETVRVMNKSSRTTLFARVIGPKKVIVSQ